MSSIREVAKKAGVSPATVSRTFSSPDLINEQTQKRVLEAARLLNYHPPRFRPVKPHRQAIETTSDTIGFQFFAGSARDTLASNNFYAPVLAGALAEANAREVHLLVQTTDRHSIGQEMPRMVRERMISGLLLTGATDAEVLDHIADYPVPIVLVDNHDSRARFESVVSDGFGGVYGATRYLQSLGHRRIGFFLPEEGVFSFQERLHGYLSAQFDAQIAIRPDWIVRAFTESASRPEGGIAAITALLRQPERPTALICANDDHAILVLQACRQCGVRVPHDLSIIGFDDIPFSGITEPGLTTIKVDKEKMGRIAMQRLLSHLQGKRDLPAPGLQHRLPVTLVVRDSCRPPADSETPR